MQPPDHMFTFTQIGPARPRTGFTTGSSRAGPPYKLQWPFRNHSHSLIHSQSQSITITVDLRKMTRNITNIITGIIDKIKYKKWLKKMLTLFRLASQNYVNDWGGGHNAPPHIQSPKCTSRGVWYMLLVQFCM